MTVIPETARYLAESLKYFTDLGFRKGLSPQPDYYADWSPQQVEDFKAQLWELGADRARRACRPAGVLPLLVRARVRPLSGDP